MKLFPFSFCTTLHCTDTVGIPIHVKEPEERVRKVFDVRLFFSSFGLIFFFLGLHDEDYVPQRGCPNFRVSFVSFVNP